MITGELKKATDVILKNKNIEKIFFLMEPHLKGKNNPCSVAVKTNKKVIYPYYSSLSMNCGMGLMRTNIKFSELKDKQYDLFKEIDRVTTLSQLGRLIGKDEITREELDEILLKGIDAIPERYFKLEKKAFEREGNLFRNKNIDRRVILDTIPKSLYGGTYREIGKNGGGNHFVEMQIVDEIYDKSSDLKKNDVLFMVHLGTGYLGDNVSSFYCNINYKLLKILYSTVVGPRFVFLKKVAFNLKRYGLRFLIKNSNLLFRNKDYQIGLEYNSKNGRDFLMAETAALNLGYSWRYITYDKIIRSLKKVIKTDFQYDLVLDKSHNSILDEKDGLYYTKNACWLKGEGDLFILPGNYTNYSYLCKAGKKLSEFDYFMDHGLGILLKEDDSKLQLKETMMKFRRRRWIKTKEIQYSYETLENSEITHKKLKEYEKKGYFKIVARFKPKASLK